jgi:acetyltransferase-like isoleucine patch superfamily enzyme
MKLFGYQKIVNFYRILRLWLQGCEIGRNCKIGKNVNKVGKGKVIIGDNVVLESYVKIKCNNYSNSNEKYQLILNDNVFIGSGTIFDVNLKVILHSNSMFGPYCFITDSNHIHQFNDIPFSHLGGIYKEVEIHSNCWVGCHCVILPGVTISKNSVIAANSVVNRNIQQGTLNAGSPSRKIK